MAQDAMFSSDYRDARDKFLTAAQNCGAELTHYALPDLLGPSRESLVTDVATLGDANAERALLMLSSTHGLEGPAGSAIQTAFLGEVGRAGGFDGSKIVLVHAINPWGFAHRSRTTEGNVDLNRNFVDFSAPRPINPGYRQLHRVICRPEMHDGAQRQILSALDAFQQGRGYDALSDALGRGQYEFPDGLSYGGSEPEWSNVTLKRILHAELKAARRVAVIDWHTGRGDFGEAFYLCFSPVGSSAFDRAAHWWGHDTLVEKDEIGEAYEGEAPPPRDGLLIKGIDRALERAEVAGAVIEIGTYEPRRVIRAEIIDRWLKFEADPADPLARRLREEMSEAFYPASSEWRRAVLENGLAAARAALEGVLEW